VVDTYGVEQVSQEELLALADVVSLHVPLTKRTRHLVNYEFLSKMKPEAFLINTSRGPVVNQQSLKSALQQKTIAGAALDVYESEPPDDLDFLSLPNLMVTPHIGGNADEAVLNMGRSAINHLKNYYFEK
jgi:D-3-phosphoglycerate dehydrogenase